MFPVRGSSEPATTGHTVVGPICSPGDTLYYSWRSRALREGDSVAIMDAGAYFVPFSTSFAFPRPAIVMLDGGESTLLRRAERFEDIVSYDREQSPA
jgi:diaminopimelate decarboxylase